MDARTQVLAGAALMAVSLIAIFAYAFPLGLPDVVLSVATLLLALGTLMVGVSHKRGRPV